MPMGPDDAVRLAEQELMTKRNVTGVGLGERDGVTVIRVFVTRKVSARELAAEDVIPRRFRGYATEVVEIGEVSTGG
jgi:hypothetical protein